MKITLVGYTISHTSNMIEDTNERWVPDNDGDAGDLAEFAGRQCYESWDRPNPFTATNLGYLQNIVRQKHLSVLEHGSVSFRVSGVSRSLTHELVRHRHFSFSQVSQRYVNPVDSKRADDPVVPPLFQYDEASQHIIWNTWIETVRAYRALLVRATDECTRLGITGHQAKKMAREAARAVLPNMTPTALVVTANHHAWFDFLGKRGSIHADQEIRMMAVEMLRQLKRIEPRIYDVWTIEAVTINSFTTEVIEFHGT
jgi:thymidylate synthase (FAD)